MKGCGGKFLSFLVGFVMGIVFVFGAVFGTVYVVATQTKVSDIENKFNSGDSMTDGKEIGGMTLYDVFVKMKDMFAGGSSPSIADVKEQFGIDVLEILESKFGLKIDGNDVYVKVEDVKAISFDSEGERSADSLDRYIYNAETKAFEKVVAQTDEETGEVTTYQQVPFGSVYDVKQTESGENVLTYKGTDVTERCGIVNDELVTTADGDFYLASKNAKDTLLATPIFDITKDINVLLDVINLDLVGELTGNTSIKDIKIMAEGSYLPIMVMLDTLMDVFNNIEQKSIGEVQDMTGITFISSDNLLSALIDVPIGKLMDEMEVMEVGKLIKTNRDSFVKYTDLQTDAAPDEIVEYGNGFKDGVPTEIGKLTLDVATGLYSSDSKHNEALYKWQEKHLGKYVQGGSPELVADYFVVSESSDESGKITYSLVSLEGGEAAIVPENVNKVYVRIYEGDGIMNALSPLTLSELSSGDFKDKFDNIKLVDVLGEDSMTGVLANFKDTKIGELADKFDNLTLGEVIDIYEEDVLDESGNVIHEKSSNVLIKFKDTKINDIGTAFNDLVLSDVMDIYEEDVLDEEGNVVHEKSNKVLIKLKDTKVNALGDEFNNLVLDDVVEIEAENVCERVGAAATDEAARNAVSAKEELYISLGSSTSSDFSRVFAGTFKVMRIVNVAENEASYGAFVKVTYAEDGSISNDGYTESTVLYRQTVEASNAVLVALKDTKVSDLATEASSVIDEMRLDEVMDVDGNVFTKLSTVPAEAEKVNYYVLDHDMYIAYDPTNSDHVGATVFYKLKYNGSANAIIKKIATVKVKNMSDSIDVAIDNTYLRELIDIKVRSEFTLDELGEYVIFATFDTEEQARETYKGTYEIMEADGKFHVMVKYKDGLTGARYHLVSAASNSALANLSNVKVGKMSEGMDDVIDQMLLSEAMVINGDVFKAKTPADEAEKATLFVFKDSMFLAYDPLTDADATEFYERVYEGAGNAVLKKLATVSVQGIPNRISVAVDETKLSELMTIKDDANVVLKKVKDVKVKNLSTEIDNAVNTSKLGELITIDDSSHVVLRKLKDVEVGKLGEEASGIINEMTIEELVNPTDPNSIMTRLKGSKLTTIEDDATDLFKTSSILDLYTWSGATVDPKLELAIKAYEEQNGTLTVEKFLSNLKVDTDGKIYLAI
ncbi:MAG TPA: hypothetical protein DEQ88_00085 [Clostridiales bacterium]|nr:hypothetical protein [Clostridiales bacterium]